MKATCALSNRDLQFLCRASDSSGNSQSMRGLSVVMQFGCHPEQVFFAQRRFWASRAIAARSLRRNNRALPIKLHHYRVVATLWRNPGVEFPW
jgi:hypothetical protein